MRRFALAALVAVAAACSGDGPSSPVTPPVVPPVVPPVTPPVNPPSATPPTIAREFRGLWVATVGNIDWPTRTGLSQTEAMAEMRTILDKAQALRMNAVILHVRASGDALYRSNLEPWAKSLTGTQGVDPGWDPLAAWVDEAHARGLEVHAWFNPFRAGNASDSTKLATNHLWKTRPDLARVWEGQLWFDPGEPDVHTWTLNVIKDVITRYDVDAVHLDDYFYPYPQGSAPVFNDDVSYNRYLAAGGAAMARADWRRRNVDTFIQALYTTVHATKPAMKVGISPFGIWRPGYPAGTTGFDPYTLIFADSKKWLENGWVDYFAPQIYWSLTTTGHDFTSLLDWWISVNSQKRHLWPGLAAYRVTDGSFASAAEITNQILVTRARSGPNAGGGSGTLLYNTTAVRTNARGLADSLASAGYAGNAVVPSYSWLDNIPPTAPSIAVTDQNSIMRVTITPGGGEGARWWMVQWRNATAWNYRLVFGETTVANLAYSTTAEKADMVVVTAFDAAWNASTAVTWRAVAQ